MLSSLLIVLCNIIISIQAITQDTINITMDEKLTTVPLPSDFASFSYEVKCTPGMFSYQGSPRKSFVNLMKNYEFTLLD